MNTDEPSVEQVGPQGPGARPTQAAGWVLLVLVVLTIVASQLASYLQQSGDKGVAVTWAAERTQAEAMLWLAEMGKATNPSSYKQAREGLARQWQEHASAASESVEAAETWVPVAYELGIPIPDSAVEQLKGESGTVLHAVYSGRSTPETLAELRAAAPTFPHRLATYHASKALGAPVPTSSIFRPARMVAVFAVLGGFMFVLLAGLVMLTLFLSLAMKIRQVGYPPQGLSRGLSDRFALRMGLYLIAYFGGVVGLLSAIPFPFSLMVKALIAMGLFVVVLIGLFAIPVAGVRDSVRSLIGVTDRPWRLVGAGLWAWLAVTPVVLVSALVMTRLFSGLPTPSHPTTVEIAAGGSALDLVATYGVAALLAPFLEELTFRGLLFPALQRWMGWVAAAALSGLVFAAVHPQGPLLWLSLGAIGAASATVAQYTGSLIPSFVLHAANNAAVLTLALVVLG